MKTSVPLLAAMLALGLTTPLGAMDAPEPPLNIQYLTLQEGFAVATLQSPGHESPPGADNPGQGRGPPDHAPANGYRNQADEAGGNEEAKDRGNGRGDEGGERPEPRRKDPGPGRETGPALELVVVREGAANVLHWTAYEGLQPVQEYVIYAYPIGGTPVSVAIVGPDVHNLTDATRPPEDFYVVVPMTGANSAGPASNPDSSEWPHCPWLIIDPDTLLGVLTDPECFLPPPEPGIPIEPSDDEDPRGLVPWNRLPDTPVNLGLNIPKE